MSDTDECNYVVEFRKRFTNNAIQFDALMIEMLADNKRFLGYLNYLGIDPMDGSPTAEEIVGMRIQSLQMANKELCDALKTTTKDLEMGSKYSTKLIKKLHVLIEKCEEVIIKKCNHKLVEKSYQHYPDNPMYTTVLYKCTKCNHVQSPL